jgi:cysteine-rich repeat protein
LLVFVALAVPCAMSRVADAAGGVVPLPPEGETLATGAVPAGSHLAYFGGPVVEHLAVVQVLWGEGDFLAAVANPAPPSIATFYQQILASTYVDWLSEYDTPTAQIGRGRFVGQFRITPSTTAVPVDAGTIVSELAQQILQGNLPPPDADTLYVVYFPRGVPVTLGSLTSCTNFCGWHAAAVTTAGSLLYSVQPDLRAPCRCHFRGSRDAVDDVTTVASHEVIETITDPWVGVAATSWFDIGGPMGNGEIADVCLGDQGTVLGTDGFSYVVSNGWSDALDACVISGTPVCGDGIVTVGEECDDGNVVAGDGCSPTCTIEGVGCPPWHFAADVTLPASFFDVPGESGRQSGAQATPDGTRVLVNKDVGGERWAIVLDESLGIVTGNVLDPATGTASFVYCVPLPDGELRCWGAEPCHAGDRQSGVQNDPGETTVLVSKDVGDERWAIGQRVVDLSVTGNVYPGNGGAPTFLRCDAVGGDGNALDCFASPACAGAQTDCASLWQSVGRVTVPANFFAVAAE